MRQPFAHLTFPARALVAATRLPMFRTKGALGKLASCNLIRNATISDARIAVEVPKSYKCSYGVDEQSMYLRYESGHSG